MEWSFVLSAALAFLDAIKGGELAGT